MRGSREFCQKGSIFDELLFFVVVFCWVFLLFFSFAGRPLIAPTLNAGLVALRMFRGIRTSIAKRPYIFVIFHGGVWTPAPPPHSRSAHNPHTYYEPAQYCIGFKFCTVHAFVAANKEL